MAKSNMTENPREDKSRRSKRSELLIGVFIGIYGNWLIAAVEKLNVNIWYSMMLFVLSLAFLVFYFQEIFSSKRQWHKFWSRSTILGYTYGLLLTASLYLNGVMDSEWFFVGVGFVFWIALMQAEILWSKE